MASSSRLSQGPAALLAARAQLHGRLTARLPEIEQAAMTRLYAVSEPRRTPDPEYMEGLRTAISAALGYLLSGVELGEERTPRTPAVVLMQARAAAHWNVSLDTVLRRCFAGYTLFGDFLIQEAEAGGQPQGAALNAVLRGQAAIFDRLVAAVTEEYGREAGSSSMSPADRHARRVERLLVGELVDTNEIDYDLGGHHLGAIAKGPGAIEALRELTESLDHRALMVERRNEDVVWLWLGGRLPVDLAELMGILKRVWPQQIPLALGEPAASLAGWRLTHRQAKAAQRVSQRNGQPVVRYGDVALLAALLQDELLTTSLHGRYLAPLEQDRDGGESLRQTLRAYFAAERNVSSAAVALGINRHTVTSRLRVIEERIGQPVGRCAAEFECALQLQAFMSRT